MDLENNKIIRMKVKIEDKKNKKTKINSYKIQSI